MRSLRLLVFFGSLTLSTLTGAIAAFLFDGFSFHDALHRIAKAIDTRIFGGGLATALYRGQIPASVPDPIVSPDEWIGGEPFIAIAHGLGPQLWRGANTRETMEEGLRRGFRVFEVDLALTSDGELVCYHGQDEASLNNLSSHTYREAMRSIGLSPMSFGELLTLVRQHPSVFVILDVKNRFDEVYDELQKEIGSPGLGRRFIPQIYNFNQLLRFRTHPFFGPEIFTSYRTPLSADQIIATAERLQIGVVTLDRGHLQALKSIPNHPLILTHPVDNPFDAAQLRARGVRGIYTSYVTPKTLPEVFAPREANCDPGRQWTGCRYTDHRPSE